MQIRTRSLCLALAAGMGLTCLAHAGEPQDATLYFNGVKVSIDPATGRLRQPTAEELKALRASVKQMPRSASLDKPLPSSRVAAERTVRKLPDGSRMATVSEDMLHSVTVARQADGSLTLSEGSAQPAQEAASE